MAALRLKVLISGAGIAGPCLAYWLARTRHSIAVTIVERSASPRATGQSIDIRGPAVEIIKQMHLEEVVRSRHTTEEGTALLNAAGKPFVIFKTGETFTADYEILRADLSQIFLDATKNLNNVRYVYGDHISSLRQTDTNVNVTFAGGSEEAYDLVVAADGSTSRTRSMILDEEIIKDSYKFLGWYNAFFSIPRLPTDTKLWQWYNAPKGLGIMIRPHRNNSTMGAYLSITMPARGQQDPAVETALNEGTESTKRMLRKYFSDAGWEAKRVLDGMDQAEDFYMSRAAHVELPKWTNKRALVIGDAAFATFGVGTSLAIQSAYILAGEISKIQSTDQIPQALESYEEIFRICYAKLDDKLPGFPQLAFPQTALGLRLRNSAIWLVNKTKLHKILPDDSRRTWDLPCYNWTSL
jgi:2-polyprenyl-6-methoxyphenol hydroxylase-like FAD-dependent oxidoreductase